MSFFSIFKDKLSKTSNILSFNILEILKNKKIDNLTLDELESVLISSDISLDVVNKLLNSIKKIKISNDNEIKTVLEVLAQNIQIILHPREHILINKNSDEKKILIFVGVNGSGKTTTLGKIANKILLNKKILIAACDTFRAAAVEQLEDWSNKNGNDFISGNLNQDPASVAYKACEKFKMENYDYLLVDTAGRLSNNTNLINQLIKLKKVITRFDQNFNLETILVLDGTNGSNMIKQVEVFGDALNISSIIITKLDGTAKGGALISVANKFEIPISFVGLGENVEDLVEFNSKIFSRSILNLDI
ncbi:signal recognition particle-docking protein FtsY [Pelagibacteraceae bacterium]|nr:signal recognition particle-docking protein FtsY [Pelagibacteraceae bacterium]